MFDWSFASFLTISGWVLGMVVVFWVASVIVVTAVAQARTAWRHGGYPPKAARTRLTFSADEPAKTKTVPWGEGQRPNREP